MASSIAAFRAVRLGLLPALPIFPGMRWRSSVRPASGFIDPCIPTVAKLAPVGPDWVYEIKHDGYRLMVRKRDDSVRVFTRRGADWTARFPRIIQAARKIKATSFLLDGEGIVYDSKGMPTFALLHSREYDNEVSLCAFDLLELAGTEVRSAIAQWAKVFRDISFSSSSTSRLGNLKKSKSS
ncbi:hypothetical protein V1278_003781 [Bradyrhizobium sp. AZCC 1577]|uniref:ATP-dependent DNA ligase n=1 Tax=Bradyrhizobium sp. AZCC 1577 TaxID=3117019 RepID=UPI002FF2553E